MTYSVPTHIHYTEENNEIIVYNTKTEKFYGLDEVGGFLWKNLVQKKSKTELIGLMSSKYEVSLSILDRDVSELIQTLLNNGLVKLDADI